MKVNKLNILLTILVFVQILQGFAASYFYTNVYLPTEESNKARFNVQKLRGDEFKETIDKLLDDGTNVHLDLQVMMSLFQAQNGEIAFLRQSCVMKRKSALKEGK